MGMYDNILNEHPLPETDYLLPVPHDGWQTKDLENAMDTYKITAEGRLLHRGEKLEWARRDTDELVNYEEEKAKRGEESMFGSCYLKMVDHWWEDTEHHGDILFYDLFALPEGGRLWAQFCARFTDGDLWTFTTRAIVEKPPPKREKLGNAEVDVTENAYGIGLKVMHLGEPPLVQRR